LSIKDLPLFFDDLVEETKYLENSKRTSKYIRPKCNALHLGQRKLFVTELYFLSKYGLQNLPIPMNKKGEITKPPADAPIMVYPGGGPGSHVLYLAMIFPGLWMHLYDMSKYDDYLIKDETRPKNVVLHSQLFLDKERDYWKKKNEKGFKIYLVSDIRSIVGNVTEEDKAESHELSVLEDDRLQNDWVETIKPIAAMLKWRTPFNLKSLKYIDGEILLQSWGGLNTTETRLIIDKPKKEYKYKKMITEKYENRNSAFNNVTREFAYFRHPIPCSGYRPYDKKEKGMEKSGLGLDHCWNCTSELLICCLYLGLDIKIIKKRDEEKIQEFMRNNKEKILLYFNNLTKYLCRPLNTDCHGIMPYNTTEEKFNFFTNMKNSAINRFETERKNKIGTKNMFECKFKERNIKSLYFGLDTKLEDDDKEVNRRKKSVKKLSKKEKK